MLSRDLPAELGRPTNGRHRAGAGRTTSCSPYEGVRADALSGEQREVLMALVDSYLMRWPEGHRELERAQVAAHLDETLLRVDRGHRPRRPSTTACTAR